MSLLRSLLAPVDLRATGSYTINDYIQWLVSSGMPLVNTTWSPTEERITTDFRGTVTGAYQANGVVFACLMTRFVLFSEARFQFQQMRGGRPGDLFGTPALQILETPEPGRTTGDLLSLAQLDADLSGDWFGVRRPQRIKRLRPDWTIVAIGSTNPATEYPGYDPDAEVIGYAYSPDGMWSSGEIWTFGRDEVAHYFPVPDPLLRFRGMPLPTSVIREIEGDSAATRHKLKFFENAATPNLVVKLPPTLDPKKAGPIIDAFEQDHKGAMNAYRTLYLLGGSDVTVVGKDLQQLEFKATQGAGETRIAAALNVRPEIVGLSEGLSGSSLNAGNFTAARRIQADKMLRPAWRNMAGSLQTIVPALSGTRLWYDDRDIPFLRDDVKDVAEVFRTQVASLVSLGNAGWDQDSAVDATASLDIRRLAGNHTGLMSVQLQPPGSTPPDAARPAIALAARSAFIASSGSWEGAEIEAGALFAWGHPLVVRYPSLFEQVDNVAGALVRVYSPSERATPLLSEITPRALLAPSTNGGH